jgi:Ca-activated chloride channel family protein
MNEEPAMKTLLRSALFALAALPLAADADSILVLDASGSMWGQVQGKPKVEIAREAVAAMLESWPADEPLGLIAYGHRRKGDCSDIEVVSMPERLDPAAFIRRVNGLQAKGMTPITASVRLAAEQLKSSEQKATVILVSDGEETCNADPCALGKELEAQSVDFTAHVIGFDLPEGPARQQLQCLASSTGGKYLEARDAGELNAALGEVASAKPVERPATTSADEWMPDMNLGSSARDQLSDDNPTEGLGYHDFTVEQTAKDCQAMCNANPNCAAWTYEPTGSFFIDHPRCALKSRGFGLVLDPQTKGEGWVSGVKKGEKVVLEQRAD